MYSLFLVLLALQSQVVARLRCDAAAAGSLPEEVAGSSHRVEGIAEPYWKLFDTLARTQIVLEFQVQLYLLYFR